MLNSLTFMSIGIYFILRSFKLNSKYNELCLVRFITVNI